MSIRAAMFGDHEPFEHLEGISEEKKRKKNIRKESRESEPVPSGFCFSWSVGRLPRRRPAGDGRRPLNRTPGASARQLGRRGRRIASLSAFTISRSIPWRQAGTRRSRIKKAAARRNSAHSMKDLFDFSTPVDAPLLSPFRRRWSERADQLAGESFLLCAQQLN